MSGCTTMGERKGRVSYLSEKISSLRIHHGINRRLTRFCAFRVRAAFADGTAGVEEVSIQGISMMERCSEKI